MRLGRILCLTSNFPRWPRDTTTPFVLHLAQDLAELGWQVTVAAPHAPGAKTREILDGIPVRRFRYLLPSQLETVCYQGGALINLRKHRTNYLKLPALVLAEWLHTVLWLTREHFDLLHSHWLLPQGFVGAMSAGLVGIPHVCTVHGGDVFGLRAPLFQSVKAFAVRHCQAVTVNSSVTCQAVRALCPDYGSIHTVPMGVTITEPAPEAVATLRQRFRPGNGPFLLFIGRLVEEKGVGDLLTAFVTVRKSHPQAHLVIVGEGQDRPRFEAQARELALSEQVTFTGWRDETELPAFLHSADLFVAPSRTAPDGWVEAQGLTIVEAMMTGLPVVASASGGIVDSVQHEESGLLVTEGRPEELAAAILRLLADPALGKRLAAKAEETAKARFSRPASALAFSGLFESLLSRQNSPGRG